MQAFAALLRRWLPLLAIWCCAALAVPVIYCRLEKPQYIASARILLRPEHIALDGSEQSATLKLYDLKGRQVETELQVIRSKSVLRYVFDILQLRDANELRGYGHGLWTDLSTVLHGLATRGSTQDDEEQAFGRFGNRFRAMRLGISNVIEVSYTADTPEQAVHVVNSVVSGYLRERIGQAASSQPGASNLNSNIAGVIASLQRAQEAVRSGAGSRSAPAEADIELLGAAVEPLSKAYPRLFPLLLVVGSVAVTSGFIAFGILFRVSPSAAKQRALLDGLGIPALCLAEARLKGPSCGWRHFRTLLSNAPPAPMRVGFPRSSWQACQAIAAARSHRSARSIGVIPCDSQLRSRNAAAAIEALIAEPVQDHRPDPAGGSGESSLQLPNGGTAVVMLPRLDAELGTGSLLGQLSIAILLVDAGRTSLREIILAVRAIRASRAPVIAAILER